MRNELLPCPFCGCTQDENGIIDHDESCFVNLFADVFLTGTVSKREIEKAWNTRAETVFGINLSTKPPVTANQRTLTEAIKRAFSDRLECVTRGDHTRFTAKK